MHCQKIEIKITITNLKLKKNISSREKIELRIKKYSKYRQMKSFCHNQQTGFYLFVGFLCLNPSLLFLDTFLMQFLATKALDKLSINIDHVYYKLYFQHIHLSSDFDYKFNKAIFMLWRLRDFFVIRITNHPIIVFFNLGGRATLKF